MSLEPLRTDRLRRVADPGAYGFATTDELEPLERLVGQDRALDALAFGVAIESPGFNIFLLGEEGTGRRSAALEALRRHAATEPRPDDWCYTNNFDDPRRPRALRLPPGTGRRLATDMEGLTGDFSTELPRVFGSEEYQAQRGTLVQRLEAMRKQLFEKAETEAERHGLAVVRSPQAILLVPKRDGALLSGEELATLTPQERERYAKAQAEVQGLFEDALRRFAEAAAKVQEELRELNRRTAEAVIALLLRRLRDRYGELPQVVAFLDAVEKDLLQIISKVGLLAEVNTELLQQLLRQEEFQRRYMVNVVVDNADGAGTPVVEEPNPTYANLLGRIEHRVLQGVLTTDYMMIRAGGLLRANGGYLLVDALELLLRPLAWPAFKRALRQGELRVEEIGAELGIITTVSLEPEPIPLDVKVVLLGPPLLYYLLYALDRDFAEIFKVKADFAPTVPRTPETERAYARFVATRCRQEGLPHFDASAVAALVEYGSRRAEDQTRLTARLGEMADLVSEAGFRARGKGANPVTQADVEAAEAARRRRANRLEEELHRQIETGALLVRTRGEAVGQVTGLSVLIPGDYAFAKPIRVSATVSMGPRGVVDLEREAELSGPIHSKGVLILSGYLNRRYGGERPLVLNATIAFEQVYEEVEGDSASVAELLALLSALSGLPLRQDLAVTGSVNQHGEIQPVGGVTEKVEGYFHACRIQGLTGSQAVVVPDRNVQHLMLHPGVLAEVEAGRFHIYAVHDVDEALTLAFARPAEDVHRAVQERLESYVSAWQKLRIEGGALPAPGEPGHGHRTE